jgi:cyclopropane-fatty-acyl-phospholipid synthase
MTTAVKPSPDNQSQTPAATAGSRPGGFYPWLVRTFMPQLTVPLHIQLWNGVEFDVGGGPPIATIVVRDRGVILRMLRDPILAFGDAYSDGRLEVHGDLAAFLEQTFATQSASPRQSWWRSLLFGWLHWPHVNSLRGSRANIHRHYNLGNDFYQLWLDPQLVYTCAYYAKPDMMLAEAQVAKMDHVCRKLGLRPGESVVEAGCGWGSLARHMAKHYGVKVKAYNISTEQIRYARERAKAEGLDDRVEFIEDDYRTISGRFDAFVSVGMLEHVGRANYRTLGEIVQRCLAPTGRGLIHSIGRNFPRETNAWLEKRIFPGAYMPSLSEMLDVVEPCGLSVLDVENLRLHYARTLADWLRNFEAVADSVSRKFDMNFVRAWRLYLAASMAGFLSGEIQLFQILLAPARNNEIPMTRNRVYEAQVAPQSNEFVRLEKGVANQC